MMRNLRASWMRLLGLFGLRRSDEEFEEELGSHIEMHIDERVRSGLSPAEARRQVLMHLGGAEQTRQVYRERATLPWLEGTLYDVRYALRGFRRNPIFALTAIVTLALGIGATTAVFTVVDRILFRSLPYAHEDRLVSVGLVAPIIPNEFMLGGSYFNWRDNQTPFATLTSETGINECDLTEHNPKRLSCANVEANFLPTLGVSPFLGRNFLPEEDRPNGPKVALVSYGLWLNQYNRDPGIINRLVNIDSHWVRVIGVLPKDFEMPALEKADIVLPEALDEAAERKADPGRVLYAFARLKAGISITQATEKLLPVFNYSLSLAPPRFRSEVHLRVRPIRDRQMQDARLIAWVLLGAVVAVLLIACANVASLLLTRAAARERELVLRSALGASRSRLVRQSLTEAMLLSLFGAIFGCVIAEGLLRIFVAVAPSSLPFLTRAQLDLRIAVFAVLVSMTSGILFGIVPAFYRHRTSALATRSTPSNARALFRSCIVVAQIAFSIILLTGATLLLRSFASLATQDLGIRSRGVLTASISLNRERFAAPQARMEFFSKAASELRRLPGVSDVAISDTVPPGGFHREQIYSIISVAGRAAATGGTGGMVAWRWVTPEYFNALDIPIVRGHGFTQDDRRSSQHSIILSSLLASRLFPNQDPIGQQIQPVPDGPLYTVRGVARDVKNAGLAGVDEPEYYRLRRHLPEDWQQAPSSVLIVKTDLPPKAVAQWVRSQIAQIDPTVPVEIETLDERLSELSDRTRFETALVSFFACTGLVMAMVGLYGVIAFMATQRTREIGVRMALGAKRVDILQLILREGIRLIMIGVAMGLVAALALSRVLKSLLFSVGPHDPISYVAVTVLLAFVALLAILVPARAAMKVEPMSALRME